MINSELLRYVKQQLSLGAGKETISNNLKAQGWDDTDIHEAFTALGPAAAPVSAPAPASMPHPASAPVMTADYREPQADFSSSGHHKSKKLFFAILILILLAGGGGAYAYYSGTFVSFPVLVSDAFKNGKTVTTFSYDANINMDFSDIKKGGQMLMPPGLSLDEFNMTMKGSYDLADSENFKSSAIVSFSSGTLSLEGEFRVVGETFYGQLTKAPSAMFIPISLAAYENKWFSMPIDSGNLNLKLKNPLSSVMSPDGSDILTKEQEEHLVKIAEKASFIKKVKKLPSEEISGEMSHHFAFDLDRDGIKSYFKSLEEYIKTIGKNDAYLSAFDAELINEPLDAIKNFKGEIWIGKKDKVIRKLSVGFGINPEKDKDEQVKVNMVFIFKDYNQPVSIAAPAESVPFQSLISGIMASSIGAAQEKGNEAAIKANMSNLRAQAELFYDGNDFSYFGFCSSREVSLIRESVKKAGGSGFVCKDKRDAYAVGVNFAQKSSGSWCVDSTGVSRSTATTPSGTACPVK